MNWGLPYLTKEVWYKLQRQAFSRITKSELNAVGLVLHSVIFGNNSTSQPIPGLCPHSSLSPPSLYLHLFHQFYLPIVSLMIYKTSMCKSVHSSKTPLKLLSLTSWYWAKLFPCKCMITRPLLIITSQVSQARSSLIQPVNICMQSDICIYIFLFHIAIILLFASVWQRYDNGQHA